MTRFSQLALHMVTPGSCVVLQRLYFEKPAEVRRLGQKTVEALRLGVGSEN